MSEHELVRARGAVLWTAFERYEQCEAACAYAVRGPKEKVPFGAWWGIFVHRFLEYVQTKGRRAALAYVGSKRLKGLFDTCQRIDVDALPEGRVELGHAWDPLSGEAVEVGRNERVPEQYQHGILDCLSDQTDGPWVIDYKTGQGRGNPAEHPQLLGNMLAVRARYQDPWNLAPGGRERPRAYFTSLAYVARDGSVTFDTARLLDTHLDHFAERARRIQLKVLSCRQRVDHGQPVAFQAGPACGDCPIAVVCPTQQKA